MCPGYCRTSADLPTTSPQKQFQKFNIQEKRKKKFNLISPPLRKVVQEKMAEVGVEPQQLFQIPPFPAVFRTSLARRLVADELELLISLARTQTENFEIYCQNLTFCLLAAICLTIQKVKKKKMLNFKCSSYLSFGPLSKLLSLSLVWI